MRVAFTAGPKAGERDIFLGSHQKGVSVNSVTGIFGPNASGKTNLLKAIAFLRHFILHSATEEPDAIIPVEPFYFTEEVERESVVCFELEFEHGEQFYRYEVKLTQDRVLSESLHRKDQRFRYLFERKWDADSEKYLFKAQDMGPTRHITQRANASFLASALLQEHPFAKSIASYFKTCYVNVHFTGRMSTHDPEPLNLVKASAFYRDHADALSRAVKYIAEADMGITDLTIENRRFLDEQGHEKKMPLAQTRHTVAGKDYYLNIFRESRGTQALFVLLRYILPVLEDGGVAVIDEFETGLHAHIVEFVVELFYSKKTNPKGAQLIANFHTDYLLRSALEKYQIVLMEKDPETQSTEAWRLDAIKGLARNANNHYAKYHAGAYGGIPNL